MIKKLEWKWELVGTTDTSETSRAKVIGGWILHTALNGGKNVATSQVFISDPDHQWIILQPKAESPPAASSSEGF